MKRNPFPYLLGLLAVGAVGIYASGHLRTSTEIAAAPAVASVACEQSFDRLAAQRQLMNDPSLVSAQPDANDTRVTPVEWRMLTDWQRQTIISQNRALPGNAGSCNPDVALGDGVTPYIKP